jgi:trk system potassium uptake protein TrkA
MNVLIVGGGQVGAYLASLLIKDEHHVKVVEMREKQLHTLQHDLPEGTVVAGNFTDPVVLETAGIQQADVVVAVTPTDEGNLVVATLARYEFGVKRVIARANNPKNSWLFTPEMGVDVGLTEADLIAHVVAEEMSLGDMMTLLQLRKGKYSLVQEKVDPVSSAVGKTLQELSLPSECVLVAIIRDSKLLLPHGDTALQANDEVLAIAHVSQAQALAAMLRPAV